MTGDALSGILALDEPLSRHTSWRVGGVARRFYQPADRSDLIAFLKQLPVDEPLLWLGLGSNLLVRDGGFPGTVIATRGRLTAMNLGADGVLEVETGASCAAASRFVARRGRVGTEFLAGIPGTIGGALAMNAGAFGGVTWEQVRTVETLDRSGCVRVRDPGDFRIGYRHVEGPRGEWFLSARMSTDPGDVEAGQSAIKALLQKRSDTQPIGLPSCGSVFRNPEGHHAARLIEAAGLKGSVVGGAQVSEKHANFIINTGSATAQDIERLIGRIRETVEMQSGIRLKTEVHIVGVEEAGHEL